MSKPNQTVNYILLGHRIHFNWPLLILLAWMTLIAFGAIYDKQGTATSCPVPYTQGESQ